MQISTRAAARLIPLPHNQAARQQEPTRWKKFKEIQVKLLTAQQAIGSLQDDSFVAEKKDTIQKW